MVARVVVQAIYSWWFSRGPTIGLRNRRARSTILFISDELTRDRIQNLITTKVKNNAPRFLVEQNGSIS
jgi:hypothetical protein